MIGESDKLIFLSMKASLAMYSLVVNVTEFSRNLSNFLNQVQYRGQVLDIQRGKRVVARVSPVSAIDGYPIAQLDALLVRGLRLDAADRKMVAKDLRAISGFPILRFGSDDQASRASDANSMIIGALASADQRARSAP